MTLKRGHDLPKKRRLNGSVPVVSSSGISGFHNESKAEAPGVVTGRYGTLGEVYFIQQAYWPLNTALYVIDFKGNDPRFIAYFLKHSVRNYKSDKAAVPGVDRNVLHRLKVCLPDRSVQEHIADILSTYDDLIENNRQRITLLERAAREIYREWFVRLRFPGHERKKVHDGTPEGWRKMKVRDLLGRVDSKKKIKKNDYLEIGNIPCVDQSRDFIGGYTNDEDAIYDDPLPIVIFGDHTRILKFIDFPFARGADGTQLLIPNRDDVSVAYFYFALDAIDLSNYFYARHFKFLKDQIVRIPTQAVREKFTAFADGAMQQIKTLREQNIALSRARDLLLPRLMSGEVAV